MVFGLLSSLEYVKGWRLRLQDDVINRLSQSRLSREASEQPRESPKPSTTSFSRHRNLIDDTCIVRTIKNTLSIVLSFVSYDRVI